MEKYTVGQIAKSLGVSNQTIRHYESLGLIASHRNDDNQYRTYSVEDTRILFMIYIYRSMGFSLPKIKEMLKEMEIDEVKQSFEQRIKEVEDQIYQLELLKHELKEYHNGIELIQQRVGECWIEENSHTMISIMKSGSSDSLVSDEDNDLLEYQKLAPHVRQGFVVSSELLTSQKQFDYQYGVFIPNKYAEKFLSENELNQYLTTLKGPLAKTIIEVKGEDLSRETFLPFLDWIVSQNLKIASDFYGVARYHAYYEQETTLFEFIVSVTY